ncbi:MAG: DUF805 domain-containing protein [Akkermansia sp.]
MSNDLPAPTPAPKWGLWNSFVTVYWYRCTAISGRASRTEYWLSWVGYLITAALLVGLCALLLNGLYLGTGEEWGALMNSFANEEEPPDSYRLLLGNILHALAILSLPATLALVAHGAGLALLCRRLRDAGLSVWWMCLLLLEYPLLFTGALLCLLGALDGGDAALWSAAAVFTALGGAIALFRLVVALLPSRCPEQTQGPVVVTPDTWSPLRALITVLFHRYADFRGRASRTEYWQFCMGGYLLGGILYILLFESLIPLLQTENFAPLLALVIILLMLYLAALVPHIALSVRRLHDIGLSGWWYLIVLLTFPACVWENNLTALLQMGVSLFFLAVSVIPSDKPNRWGEGPRARSH